MNNIKSNVKKSIRDYWETPQYLVNQVSNLLFCDFVLDPCSTDKNKKGDFYIPEWVDGLQEDWRCLLAGLVTDEYSFCPAVWVNPPFSKLDQWVDKVIHESSKNGLLICMLHPDTPDPAWYQKIEKHCFMQLVPDKRINFVDPETGKEKSGVNFPSCISVFNAWPKNNVQRIRFTINKDY
jgi:phage N-6-adenine-methyltransferase